MCVAPPTSDPGGDGMEYVGGESGRRLSEWCSDLGAPWLKEEESPDGCPP